MRDEPASTLAVVRHRWPCWRWSPQSRRPAFPPAQGERAAAPRRRPPASRRQAPDDTSRSRRSCGSRRSCSRREVQLRPGRPPRPVPVAVRAICGPATGRGRRAWPACSSPRSTSSGSCGTRVRATWRFFMGSDNKGYFLHVGDEVYDGTLIAHRRHGRAAVTFRQQVDDPRHDQAVPGRGEGWSAQARGERAMSKAVAGEAGAALVGAGARAGSRSPGPTRRRRGPSLAGVGRRRLAARVAPRSLLDRHRTRAAGRPTVTLHARRRRRATRASCSRTRTASCSTCRASSAGCDAPQRSESGRAACCASARPARARAAGGDARRDRPRRAAAPRASSDDGSTRSLVAVRRPQAAPEPRSPRRPSRAAAPSRSGLAACSAHRSAAPEVAAADPAATDPVADALRPRPPAGPGATVGADRSSDCCARRPPCGRTARRHAAGRADSAVRGIVRDQRSSTGERRPTAASAISLNLVDADLKQVFRLFHEISGLNFVLDPSVTRPCHDRARPGAVGSGARHHPQEQRPGQGRSRTTSSASRRRRSWPRRPRRASSSRRPRSSRSSRSRSRARCPTPRRKDVERVIRDERRRCRRAAR